MSKMTLYILFFAVLALGAFFRFYLINEIPPGLYPDEAMNGNNALEALKTGDFKVFYPENNGREGLFINLQAFLIWLFGNEPRALRLASAIFGTLTILGLFLLTRELFRPNSDNQTRTAGQIQNSGIALLSSFFLAASYWHVNFSRIGFRAIMVSFFAVFGMYFLLKGLRRGKIFDLGFAGAFIGLGFHTYPAFRFMPFVVLVPLIAHFSRRMKKKTDVCFPCAAALFIFAAFAAALPLGTYFLQNPQDFFGRVSDVSIFSAEKPLPEFLKSAGLTMQMFFYQGDCNWRHNFNCQPQLHPLVGVFFLIGIFKFNKYKFQSAFLLVWLIIMSLPAILTKEGLPHALRSIGVIPPAMILAGLGASTAGTAVYGWLEKQKQKHESLRLKISRIQKEFIALAILTLLWVPLSTYISYFVRWAYHPNTYFAFSTDIWHLGQFLANQPDDIKKYAVVNYKGVDVRGLPTAGQTVMFATDTFLENERAKKNLQYLVPEDIKDGFKPPDGQKTIIALLDGRDRELIKLLRQKFPAMKIQAPADFTIMRNY